jgi:hypothetical protein
LVICCEGNAGFYEIGIMSTPIGSGYSVLGWNYPGFGWSKVRQAALVCIVTKAAEQCISWFYIKF